MNRSTEKGEPVHGGIGVRGADVATGFPSSVITNRIFGNEVRSQDWLNEGPNGTHSLRHVGS